MLPILTGRLHFEAGEQCATTALRVNRLVVQTVVAGRFGARQIAFGIGICGVVHVCQCFAVALVAGNGASSLVAAQTPAGPNSTNGIAATS